MTCPRFNTHSDKNWNSFKLYVQLKFIYAPQLGIKNFALTNTNVLYYWSLVPCNHKRGQ